MPPCPAASHGARGRRLATEYSGEASACHSPSSCTSAHLLFPHYFFSLWSEPLRIVVVLVSQSKWQCECRYMDLKLDSNASSDVVVQVCRSWARLCESAFREECHRKGWSLPRLPRGATPAFPVRDLLSSRIVTAQY
jgi:hypothetical protein